MIDRIVLIHGAATTGQVWRRTAEVLRESTGLEVLAPTRPQSGQLDIEIDFLRSACAGAFVIGVSGGATLGLELAARRVPMAGAVLHEPAAGSLAPGLLRQVAEALEADGVEGFGRALYGPSWDPSMAGASLATVASEFAMFAAFEPRPVPEPAAITLTHGERSPAARRDSVHALARALRTNTRVLDGVSHAAHLEGAFLDPGHALPEMHLNR